MIFNAWGSSESVVTIPAVKPSTSLNANSIRFPLFGLRYAGEYTKKRDQGHCAENNRNHLSPFAAEGVVFNEQFVELRVVFQDQLHLLAESFVVHHARHRTRALPKKPLSPGKGFYVLQDSSGMLESTELPTRYRW